MRTIKTLHKAEYAPIADLVTYRALPTKSISQIDPFLFLNHHGPQIYPPQNSGLPFGPHPHRGMETVTFILAGDIMHKDSTGHESIITEGGVQWMTAGKGLIHAEVSSDTFKEKGGNLEILQLWLNLPAKLKMSTPHYTGLQKEEIPAVVLDEGKVAVHLISGDWKGKEAAFKPLIDIHLNIIYFKPGGKLNLTVPSEHHVFCYIIRGALTINDENTEALHLVEFKNDAEGIQIEASADSVLLFGHAKPLNEPVVAQGPFVMNTKQEIHQAYEDYQQGRFGEWQG